MKVCFIDQGQPPAAAPAEAIARHMEQHADVFHRREIAQEPNPAGIAPLASEAYDIICVARAGPVAAELARRHLSARLVVLSGADGAIDPGPEVWAALAHRDDIRVISFLSMLHQRAVPPGVNSFYTRYCPSPVAPRAWSRSLAVRCGQDRDTPPSGSVDRMLSAYPDMPQHRETNSSGAQDRHLALACGLQLLPGADAGDGLAFLGAMAAGKCVIAPDRPAVREYLTHGVTGLVYDPERPEPLDLDAAAVIGQRARQMVVQEHLVWQWDLDNRLHALLFEPVLSYPEIYRDLGLYVRTGEGNGHPPIQPLAKTSLPRVSVAVVCYNAEHEITATLRSIWAQTYDNMEIVVVDGQSTDCTPEILYRNRDQIDVLVSEPDLGIYDAMNKAARLASGDYVIFINAGDQLYLPGALETAMRSVFENRVPLDLPDVILGDRIYHEVTGIASLHKAADFEDSWTQLQSGQFRHGWWQALPFHQATLTRRKLLADAGYDLSFDIAADHAFLFSSRARGARFAHCHTVIAACSGGGVSATQTLQCMRESFRVSSTHTRTIKPLERLYIQIYKEDAILTDPEQTEADAEMLRQSGLFCEEWYKARYMGPDCPYHDPVLHYLIEGSSRGTRPHPLFDPVHYLQHAPEAAGRDPFVHYVTTRRAGRRPRFSLELP